MITVTYKGKTAEFGVTVRKRQVPTEDPVREVLPGVFLRAVPNVPEPGSRTRKAGGMRKRKQADI